MYLIEEKWKTRPETENDSKNIEREATGQFSMRKTSLDDFDKLISESR